MIKIILFLLLSQVGESGLKERIETALKAEKPILTVFSAKWCTPCQQMKKAVIEPMSGSGELKDVYLVYVDVDKEKEFTERHIGKNFIIPKILLFFRENGKWLKYELTGYQTKEKILQVIDLQKKRK
jgi:thioredoxin-related protein